MDDDEGAGYITITAPNKLTLNATGIEINVGNSVKVNGDSTTCGGGEGTIELKANKSIDATADTDNISLIATEKDINVTAKVNLALEDKSSALFKKDDSNI